MPRSVASCVSRKFNGTSDEGGGTRTIDVTVYEPPEEYAVRQLAIKHRNAARERHRHPCLLCGSIEVSSGFI